jgi:mono/diheme cytochrome c family protein
MKRILKWIGRILGVLLLLIVVAGIGVFLVSNGRINKTYDITVDTIPIPNDAEAIAQGEHIALTRGCADCHGADLAGDILLDDPAIGTIYTTNLTSGQGGIGADHSDEDYLRALRRGVGHDGRPLLIMPSQEFYYLSDEDTGTLIAYLKTLPPVDKEQGENSVGPMARVLLLAGALPLLSVELIDPTAPRTAPAAGVTAEYGAYLAVGCAGCHGAEFAGGPVPGAPPGVIALNLTPGGELQTWTEDDFRTLLRSGITPTGEEMGEWMPIDSTKYFTDEEISAIWLYLQSLPAKEQG